MRTFEEIKEDLDHAYKTNNPEALLRLATQLDGVDTLQAEAMANRSRGWAHYLRSNYSTALEHLHHALALFEDLDNRNGVANVTTGIGVVYMKTGDYPAALEHYNHALAHYEELGNRSGMANVMSNIAIVHNRTGDYPAALEHYHHALALLDDLGERHRIAGVIGNLGNAYKDIGDYPAALEHFHRALVLHEELGERNGVAGAMSNIGTVHESTGDYSAALEYYYRALADCEELGNRHFAANIIGNIGSVLISTGDYPAALTHYHRALALHEELGERGDVARVTGNILAAYVTMRSDADAQATLHILDNMHIDEPRVRVSRELERATLQQRAGDSKSAAAILQRALGEAHKHGLRSHAADAHKSLRDLALSQSDLAGYVEHNNEFTRITEEINGKETATKLAMQAKQREIDAREREHAQQMAVLHSTLPKHIADRVARGETVNDHYENASVIFLDIVGFTSISDRIPSGHVVHLLEQIFTTLDDVCKRNDVVKIKTIGDSYMAVSFESVPHAASCALDMIASLDALEITMPPSLGDTSWTKDVGDIKVRVGVHCGPLTAGVIGSERMQYDVWGDTVNVASRMESTSEPGKIQISETFAALMPATYSGDSGERPIQVIERGTIDVKGKGFMMTYWLESPLS